MADAATETEIGDSGGTDVNASRKRGGIVVPEATGAGLAPWSGQIGAIHGGRGRSGLNRVGHLGTVAA